MRVRSVNELPERSICLMTLSWRSIFSYDNIKHMKIDILAELEIARKLLDTGLYRGEDVDRVLSTRLFLDKLKIVFQRIDIERVSNDNSGIG